MKPLKCQRCGAAIDSTEWELSQKIFGKKASFCVACMREEKKLAYERAKASPESVTKPFLFYLLPQILILYCVISVITMMYVPGMVLPEEMSKKLQHAYVPLVPLLCSGIAYRYHFFGDKLFILFGSIDTVFALAMLIFTIAGAVYFVRNGFVPVNIRVTGYRYEATLSGDTINVERKEQYGGFLSIFVNILLFILGFCFIAAFGSLIFAVNVFLSRRERRQAKKICKRFERLN